MVVRSLALLGLLFVLLPAAQAPAAKVPPGNAGATQYTESVPGAEGEESGETAAAPQESSSGKEGGTAKATKSSKESAPPESAPAAPEEVAPEYEEFVPEEEAASVPTESEATPSAGKKHKSEAHRSKKHQKKKHVRRKAHERHHRSAGAAVATPGGPGPGALGGEASSGAGEVLGGILGTSGGGLGFLQALIVAAVLVGAAGYAIGRRHGRPTGAASAARRR